MRGLPEQCILCLKTALTAAGREAFTTMALRATRNSVGPIIIHDSATAATPLQGCSDAGDAQVVVEERVPNTLFHQDDLAIMVQALGNCPAGVSPEMIEQNFETMVYPPSQEPVRFSPKSEATSMGKV